MQSWRRKLKQIKASTFRFNIVILLNVKTGCVFYCHYNLLAVDILLKVLFDIFKLKEGDKKRCILKLLCDGWVVFALS